jgi:hypothetical protein
MKCRHNTHALWADVVPVDGCRVAASGRQGYVIKETASPRRVSGAVGGGGITGRDRLVRRKLHLGPKLRPHGGHAVCLRDEPKP